ncbi:MAG TPA: hypothetical protein VJN42_07635 [Candidatus Acidoferrum sp.]|nr:hypothetical protein [Candidatus Acidoferrum sp.]
MATTAREFSLDYYLLDRLRFSGISQENLNDLVSIVSSLKNKYGLLPFAASAEGQPTPNAITTFYVVDSLMLNKVTSVLLDTPRLHSVTILPRGIPKSGQYELQVTLGG